MLNRFGIAMLVACIGVADFAIAQSERALDRRAARNERQLQRQVNRAEYYGNNNWQQLDPWLERNGIRAAANATARAANATANVTANAVAPNRTAYGYRDNTNNNAQWFYDYYTLAPTYFSKSTSKDAYGAVIRYFDADGDGVYDSYAQHRDADNDGAYDEYDRLDFAASGNAENDSYAGLSESKRYTVQGTVVAAKNAQVGQEENLVVQVQQAQQEDIIVDLGPTTQLSAADVTEGTNITATGWIEQVGDKKLLVADTVAFGQQQEIQIQREYGKPIQGRSSIFSKRKFARFHIMSVSWKLVKASSWSI